MITFSGVRSIHDLNSFVKYSANLTLYIVCSVHQGMFSTSGRVQTLGGYHKYIGEDIMSTSGDTMGTLGGYHEYIGGYHDACGGYHEYIGVFNINQRLLSTCSPT